MKSHGLMLGISAAALIGLSACGKSDDSGREKAQTPAAEKAAGSKTIAAGLTQDSKFLAAAKAAGMDQTLAGPGPYTVFVPDDAAFNSAPAGSFDAKPENRAQITATLTNLILPGTVLAADIGKAIDNGKGKAQISTMGGGMLTFTREGGKTMVADSSGHKATITKADDEYSNGVVHHVDALLMPAKGAANEKAPGVGKRPGG